MNAAAPAISAAAAVASAFGIEERCQRLIAALLKARAFVADLQHEADPDAAQLLTEIEGVLKREPNIVYRGWSISYDPPPIPVRDCDWQFSHPDFDASWEGEEDGWVGNGLCGTAPSLSAAIGEIDEREGDA